MQISIKKNIICIFQPHRYSRTKSFLTHLKAALQITDTVILTEIFAANEPIDYSVNANDIVSALKEQGKDAFYIPDKDAIPTFIQGKVSNNDMVITMGTGNISSILPKITQELKKKT